MYFFLDSSLADAGVGSNVNELGAIENILASAFEGNHVVFGDLRTLRYLRGLEGLGKRGQSVLDYLINWYSQNKGFYANLIFKIIVEHGVSGIVRSGNKEWRASLIACGSLDSVAKATILAENLLDSKLYRWAAEHYRLNKGLAKIRIAAEHDGAGGSQTSTRFNDIAINSNSLCICVTDSDRFSPTDSPSSTSRTCQQTVANTSRPLWHTCTTPRELENILPRAIFEECLETDAAKRWGEIKELADQIGIEWLDYADLKNGVSVWWAVSHPKESMRRSFWIDVLNSIDLNDQPGKCFRQGQCLLNKTSNDDLCDNCNVIPGVSARLANAVLQWMESHSTKEVLESVNRFNNGEWMRIGSEVLGYCAAPERFRL